MSYKIKAYLWCLLTGLVFVFSCQEPYIPETLEENQQYVVEGVIEAGPGSNVAYVFLTKSIPFIGTIDQEVLEEIFVRGASVMVNDGEREVMLTELCTGDLPDQVRDAAYEILGFDPDSIALNICAYVDVFDEINRERGRTYDLEIRINDATLNARTTIPTFVPIRNFTWQDPPGEPNDTLAELLITIDDPAGVKNFYRYFTGIPGEPLISPFASVAEDVFFDGKSFEFPLTRAEPRGSEFDPETFGLFPRGDSVIIKWTTIDEASFRFWNTLEFSANSGGPFSSYTRVQSNVNGGLGVWSGYAIDHYRLLTPPK